MMTHINTHINTQIKGASCHSDTTTPLPFPTAHLRGARHREEEEVEHQQHQCAKEVATSQTDSDLQCGRETVALDGNDCGGTLLGCRHAKGATASHQSRPGAVGEWPSAQRSRWQQTW